MYTVLVGIGGVANVSASGGADVNISWTVDEPDANARIGETECVVGQCESTSSSHTFLFVVFYTIRSVVETV